MPPVPPDTGLTSIGDRIAVNGDLVAERARRLSEAIMFQCRHGQTRSLVIDLSGVERIDLTGVRALVTAARYASGRGRDLVFENAPEVVIDALERAGIATNVPIRP